MKLTSPQGEFELTILDYEYSDSPHFMERNWLLVILRTRIDGHDYQRMAPLLSTWEVELLHDWMCSITTNGLLSPRLSFIEPALTFRVGAIGQNNYRLQIKVLPDGVSAGTEGLESQWFSVAADAGQMQSAICDLESQLARFPVRN